MDKTKKSSVQKKQVAVKTYTKRQLAELYKVDVRTFKNWIKRNDNLLNQLTAAGYKFSQRSFTPSQVELIFNNIGQP